MLVQAQRVATGSQCANVVRGQPPASHIQHLEPRRARFGQRECHSRRTRARVGRESVQRQRQRKRRVEPHFSARARRAVLGPRQSGESVPSRRHSPGASLRSSEAANDAGSDVRHSSVTRSGVAPLCASETATATGPSAAKRAAKKSERSWPHSSAMNGAEIDTFAARLHKFADKGLARNDGEALADKLVLRDRDQDDRRVCLECKHLAGHGAGSWRCG